jgi:uncharacterized membrane protein
MKNNRTTYDDVNKLKNQTNNSFDMQTFINDLKREDARSLKKIRTAKWIFISMLAIYLLAIILKPNTELNIQQKIADGFYAIACFSLIFAVRYINRLHKNVDYSEPLYVLLQKTVQRHTIGAKRFLMLLPAIVIMDIGYTISYYYSFSYLTPFERILALQMVYIIVMVVVILLAMWKGKNRRKHIRDKALQMLKDLEE